MREGGFVEAEAVFGGAVSAGSGRNLLSGEFSSGGGGGSHHPSAAHLLRAAGPKNGFSQLRCRMGECYFAAGVKAAAWI